MTLTLSDSRRLFANDLAEALAPELRHLGCQRDGGFLYPAVVAQALREVVSDWHVERDLDHLRDAEGTIHDGTDLRREVVEPSVDLVAWRVRTGWRPVRDAGPADETSTEARARLLAAASSPPPGDVPVMAKGDTSRPSDTLALLGQTRWWRAQDGWVRRRDMSVAHKASVVAWLERHVELLRERVTQDLVRLLATEPANTSDAVSDLFASLEWDLESLLALRHPDCQGSRLDWLRGQPLYRRLAKDVARGRGAPEHGS